MRILSILDDIRNNSILNNSKLVQRKKYRKVVLKTDFFNSLLKNKVVNEKSNLGVVGKCLRKCSHPSPFPVGVRLVPEVAEVHAGLATHPDLLRRSQHAE